MRNWNPADLAFSSTLLLPLSSHPERKHVTELPPDLPPADLPGADLPSADLHRRLGLTDAELAAIVELLGRPPTGLELAMYAVMWSEHCSYKSSKVHLR